MISIKSLLVIALVIGILWLLRRLRRRLMARRTARPRYLETVRCGQCGVHLPRNQAVGSPGQGYYCSEEHRLARQAAMHKDST
ncbi:MAG: hypothetical protein M3Z21_11055 [Pseudomonadota bacterium]|nr:hypothetical protein [Pseudomonadota bacterium]